MKKFLPIILFFFTISTFAGFKALTSHSRANCLSFNESVTWDAMNYWWILVTSTHSNYREGIQHQMYPANTSLHWRDAKFHMFEGYGDWEVFGIHRYASINLNCESCIPSDNWEQASTETVTCNLYDGWWDSDHPERASE